MAGGGGSTTGGGGGSMAGGGGAARREGEGAVRRGQGAARRGKEGSAPVARNRTGSRTPSISAEAQELQGTGSNQIGSPERSGGAAAAGGGGAAAAYRYSPAAWCTLQPSHRRRRRHSQARCTLQEPRVEVRRSETLMEGRATPTLKQKEMRCAELRERFGQGSGWTQAPAGPITRGGALSLALCP